MDRDDVINRPFDLTVDLVCTCGHPFTQHQTGQGPWTGFCYGTLAELDDPVPEGADPAEPCACERPEVQS